jgi:predicted SAM-dependent methyltransferase
MPLEIRTQGEEARQDITADESFSDIKLNVDQRLDIGCGQRLEKGWTGIDIVDEKDAKVPEESKYIKHDILSFPWPIENNSIYEAKCSHVVEHIPHYVPGYPIHKNGLIMFMEEVYRILMVQGIFIIDCPYYSSQRMHQDPTHVRSITENTFRYFDPKWMAEIGMDHYGIKTNFEILSTKLILDPDFEPKNRAAQMYSIKYVLNAVQDIHIVLRKRG